MELILPLLVVAVIIILGSVKQINEYERGVKFTLGKFTGIMNPGWNLVLPIFQSYKKVDIRTRTVDVPEQEAITKDKKTPAASVTAGFLCPDEYQYHAVQHACDYAEDYHGAGYGEHFDRRAGDIALGFKFESGGDYRVREARYRHEGARAREFCYLVKYTEPGEESSGKYQGDALSRARFLAVEPRRHKGVD